MNTMRFIIIITLLFASLSHAEEILNKKQQMYYLYYLPFNIEFIEGKTKEDIYPFRKDEAGQYTKLVKPEEFQELDAIWNKLREEWKNRSLILSATVQTGKSVQISPHLSTHKIALNRTAIENLPLDQQIKINAFLADKPETIKNTILQMRFFKSFIPSNAEDKFHFFVVAPDWCESSKEYIALLEHYLKSLGAPKLHLHFIVVEDNQEQIFESPLIKTLFPNPKKYSHDSVPKFAALETDETGKTKIYEEADALWELYNRYYEKHQGFLNSKVPFLNKSTAPKFTALKQD